MSSRSTNNKLFQHRTPVQSPVASRHPVRFEVSDPEPCDVREYLKSKASLPAKYDGLDLIEDIVEVPESCHAASGMTGSQKTFPLSGFWDMGILELWQSRNTRGFVLSQSTNWSTPIILPSTLSVPLRSKAFAGAAMWSNCTGGIQCYFCFQQVKKDFH